jgi:hypothetical protein
MRKRDQIFCTFLVAALGAALVLAQAAQSGRPSPPPGQPFREAAAAPASASGSVQHTNTGVDAPVIFTGHVLEGQSTRDISPEEVAEIRAAAAAAPAQTPDGPQPTNGGEMQLVEFTGHQLTYGDDTRAGGILYAPAAPDTPAFRTALAAATGLTVDYYDARAGTPDIVLLCTYDYVFTWPENAYQNNVLFGDNLADYVDIGCGKVILGQWCLPTQSYWLLGRIMDAGYCPVTATDDTRVSRTYAGDGADCVHYGPPFVGTYTTSFRDDCTLRSGNQSDGTYLVDGRLSVAWRPDRRVYYSAGNTGTYYGTGEWADLTANMCLCTRTGGLLYAPSNPDNPAFRLAVAQCLGKPVDYFDARVGTPTLELLSSYEAVLTWANYGYQDKVAFGNALADYVDGGGRVILGQWCYHSDQGNYLDGRIMTTAYCPITASTSYRSGAYVGDGVDCVHTGPPLVTAYSTSYLDSCTLVAGGLSDGNFNDAGALRISVAWRADRRVFYSAGNTGGTYGTGDWDELTCNMIQCFAGCGDPGAGSCCEAHATPGCFDQDCCMAVCEQDPYCCETAWDSICAQEAAANPHCLDCICASETTPAIAQLDAPPEMGSGCACGNVSVTGSAYDPDGTFDSWVLDYRALGAGSWTVIAASTSPVVGGELGVWNTAALPQGYYIMRLSARNICGLGSTAVRSVFLDQVYDTLVFAYPSNGSVVGGNVCITGTVYESWCGSTYTVRYRVPPFGFYMPVDPAHPSYSDLPINQTIASWNTQALGLADGTYNLQVTAWNECQHSDVEVRTVIVDNTYPTALIELPISCAALQGVVEVMGTAMDANIGGWALQFTGGDHHDWVTLASGSTSVVNGLLYEWDVSGLPPCAYTLRLLVSDEAVVGCGPYVHQTEYLTSVIVGPGFVIPGDLNCDGRVNVFDIDPFVHCLTTGDCDCP